MKKYILIFAVIFLPLLASAQSKQLKDQFKEYTNNGYYKKQKNADGIQVIVVQEVVKGLAGGKNQIYTKAKAFVENSFKTVNSEIYLDDPTTGVYELSTYYRGLSQWKHEGTINTELNAYAIVRIEVKNTSVRITIESDAWNVRMGQGRNKKELEGEIVKYAPITGKKLIDNAKQTEAFINLINSMFETIDGTKEALMSNKAPIKTTSRTKAEVSSRATRTDNTSENEDVPARTTRTTRTTNTPTRTTRSAPVEETQYEEEVPAPTSSRSSNLRSNATTNRSYSSPRNRSSSAASYEQSRSTRTSASRSIQVEDDEEF